MSTASRTAARANEDGRPRVDGSLVRVSHEGDDRLLPELETSVRAREGPRPEDLLRRLPDDRVELGEALRKFRHVLNVFGLDGGEVFLCDRVA